MTDDEMVDGITDSMDMSLSWLSVESEPSLPVEHESSRLCKKY